MTSQRLQNDALARILHNSLYQRLLLFCQQYTPELPAESIVAMWMSRLFQGDPNLHILVTLDDNYKITGHAVIDIQEAYGCRVVFCHQAQGDKNNTGTVDEGVEYVDKLVEQIQADSSCFVVTKHIRSLEKKYGYKVARTMMIKQRGDNNDTD